LVAIMIDDFCIWTIVISAGSMPLYLTFDDTIS